MNINRITLFPGLEGFAESFNVGLHTVYGAHVVKQGDKDLPPDQLWQRFFKSKTG
jgi:hypothetical protein